MNVTAAVKKPTPIPHTTTTPLFRCSLDEHPPALLPKRAAAAWNETRTSQDLVLNPACFLAAPELRSLPFVERFASLDDAVWVLDQQADALMPFWVSKELKSQLAKVAPGAPAPHGLPDNLLKSLESAGIFVASDHEPRRRQEYTGFISECAALFRANRYIALHDLLHPLHLAALRGYMRALIASGGAREGNGGYRHCNLIHNDPVTRFFHHQLTSVVSRITGQPVQPSYAFVISYRAGSALRRHVDRSQCEFTITLALDFVPEPEDATPWPLYVETPGGVVTVEQSLGDGLLFAGRELPHHRHKLAKGCISTAVLFHFVPRNFEGRLE